MKNNKGQSLVMFILIIPFILLILWMVIDIGKMVLNKTELDNINKLVLDYGLDKLNDNPEEVINELIIKNDKDIKIKKVDVLDGKIYVEIYKRAEFGLFRDSETIKVKSSYVGYMVDDKKIIERN